MLLRAGSHQVPRGGEEHPFVQSLGQSWVAVEGIQAVEWQTGKRKLANIDRDSEHKYRNTIVVFYVSCVHMYVCNIDLHNNNNTEFHQPVGCFVSSVCARNHWHTSAYISVYVCFLPKMSWYRTTSSCHIQPATFEESVSILKLLNLNGLFE